MRQVDFGNPSYGGYEYQILVTIWSALELMLAKKLTEEIFVEPPSHEDVEAKLNVDADKASSGINIFNGQIDLMIQVKSRSTGPWSSSEISTVLLGDSAERKSKRGPTKRARPLEILRSSPAKHYIFVTDAALEKGLMPHSTVTLLEWPRIKNLPPNCRDGFSLEEQENIAPRIALCSIITHEVLNSRIGQLLSHQGHVPIQSHLTCITALKEEVRIRLLGQAGGRWTLNELLDLLHQSGGSVLPNRMMSYYVPPSSYSTVIQALNNRHAVIITGPSGTGKTLTADILEHQLRNAESPFLVVYGNMGPGEVRDYLRQPGPVLFHLRDPWGANRLSPEADSWSSELPKLLKFASVEKKFLVTSRTDILSSAGYELSKQLEPFKVPIEIEHYGRNARETIYDNHCRELSGELRRLVPSYREQVLCVLQRPYEIERFFAGLNEVDDLAKEVGVLISKSQIDAISSVVEQQILADGERMIPAAVVWGVLSAHPAISSEVIPRLRRLFLRHDPPFRPKIDELIRFLIAGRNVRSENGVLSFFHPKVEDGIRSALGSSPGETEYALGLLCDALISMDLSGEWGTESALNVLKASAKFDGICPNLAPESEASLNSYLEKRTLECSKGAFERAFADLGKWGSKGYLPSELARCLLCESSQTGAFHITSWANPNLSPASIESIKQYPKTPELIRRFVCDMLPFTDTIYGQDIVSFVRALCADSESLFLQAIRGISNDPTHAINVEHVVEGALAGEEPPYELVLEHFLGMLEKENAWWEGYKDEYRRAEEFEIDALYADHIFEEPGEHFHLPNEGLNAVVNLRCERNGSSWVTSNPINDDLIRSWARVASKKSRIAVFSVLSALLDLTTNDWTRGKIWSVAANRWSTKLTSRLHHDLARTNIHDENLNEALLSALAATKPNDLWLDDLIQLSRLIVDERNIELVYDLATTKIDDDDDKAICIRRAQKFAGSLDGSASEVGLALADILNESSLGSAGVKFSSEVIAFLTSILPRLSPRIAGPLNCLGAIVGIDPLETSKRLLSLDESQAGRSALQALAIAGTTECYGEIRKALKHSRCDVRCDAIRRLVSKIPQNERDVLVALAQDPSAKVRLEFARQMQVEQWPETISSLIALLSDTRDFSSDPGYFNNDSWPEYLVAREAADALKRYSQLDQQHIAAIIELVTAGSSKDPLVTCGILTSLSTKNNALIDPFLVRNLRSPGLNISPRYNPIAQAAAWALFDRAVKKVLNLSSDDIRLLRDVIAESNELIVGPIIATIGFYGNIDLVRLIASEIAGLSNSSICELLLVATACSESGVDNELIQSLNLSGTPAARLVEIMNTCSGDNDDVSDEIKKDETVSSWSKTLSSENFIVGMLAWLLNLLFKLQIPCSDENPRAYKLPHRIPIMTTRSLSSMREEK